MFRNSALLVIVLVAALSYPVMPCETSDGMQPTADSSTPEKNKTERDRCKHAEGSRTPRGCPDGGERLPQDKRSPLDSLPPLSPLVA
jgi:hypothetical protein